MEVSHSPWALDFFSGLVAGPSAARRDGAVGGDREDPVRAAARLAGDLFPRFLVTPLGRPATVGERELCRTSQSCVLSVLAGGGWQWGGERGYTALTLGLAEGGLFSLPEDI